MGPLILNVLFPAALIGLWLIAEFRWRRSVRVALGVACILLPFLWLSGVIYTANLLTSSHDFALSKMEELLQEHREPLVRRALRIYDETYQETGSAKSAVFRMNQVLLEQSGE